MGLERKKCCTTGIGSALLKNRCQVWCLKCSVCARPKKNINLECPMICINCCIQWLQGFSFPEYGMSRSSSWPCVLLCSPSLKLFHSRGELNDLQTLLCVHVIFMCSRKNRKLGTDHGRVSRFEDQIQWKHDKERVEVMLFVQPCCGSYPGTFATTLRRAAAVMVPPGQDCVLCSARCGNHPRTAGRNTF